MGSRPNVGVIGATVKPLQSSIYTLRQHQEILSTYKFLDTFTNTNGTTLADHNQWVLNQGTPKIQSNKAAIAQSDLVYLSSDNFWRSIATKSFLANGIIETDISYADNGYGYGAGYCVFRYKDINNFLIAGTTNTGQVIYKIENGVTSQLALVSGAIGPSTTGRIKITFYNQAINLDLAPTLQSGYTLSVSTTSSFNQQSTNHGLYFFSYPGAVWNLSSFDNFSFVPL